MNTMRTAHADAMTTTMSMNMNTSIITMSTMRTAHVDATITTMSMNIITSMSTSIIMSMMRTAHVDATITIMIIIITITMRMKYSQAGDARQLRHIQEMRSQTSLRHSAKTSPMASFFVPKVWFREKMSGSTLIWFRKSVRSEMVEQITQVDYA